MDLANEISEVTARMETEKNPFSYEELYYLLLRAMLNIRSLEYRVRALEGNPV